MLFRPESPIPDDITLPTYHAQDGSLVDAVASWSPDRGWQFAITHYDEVYEDTARVVSNSALVNQYAPQSAFAAGMALFVQQRVYVATFVDPTDDIPPGTEPVPA